MAAGPALLPSAARARIRGPDFAAHVWSAPLIPAALALTFGIVLDRYLVIPIAGSLITAAILLVAWMIASFGRETFLALIYLWGGVGALAAAYHRWHLDGFRADDISRYAATQPVPVTVRGIVHGEVIRPRSQSGPLRIVPDSPSLRFVLRATALMLPDGWQTVSGRVQVHVTGQVRLRAGDEVECVGRLAVPEPPGNPGEFDYAAHLRSQGIRTTLAIRDGKHDGERDVPAAIRTIAGGLRSFAGWLSAIGDWCKNILEQALPESQARIARALLLGDGSAMTGEDWEQYLRTGVIHALAISGQHLVVLGGFVWIVLRVAGMRRRTGALLIAAFLMGYALLVGGRPPVMRAAWMVLALSGGLWLQRPVQPANSFALAWILVVACRPTDVFNSGCLLSFLAVAMLIWGSGQWQAREMDPLDKLIDESRPAWQRLLRWLGKIVLWAYAVNLAVWLAVSPLVAARFHLVSPVALLIGPPVVMLTSIALLTGFLVLIFAPIFAPLGMPFAALTSHALLGCDMLVSFGDNMPGAYWYVADIPEWWLWPFYVGLLAALLVEPLRRRWGWGLLAATGWLAVGLLVGALPRGREELRCTFLAVGHGGCTVIETPDGRTLLYDAGALTGPDVTRKYIAPYLGRRGITRIDELFISHADLDHFNGIQALLDRFGAGQVTCTPTFAQRSSKGVPVTLDAIRKRGVPVRITKSGDRLRAGAVQIDVLHPPAKGPEGKENARSMVLQIGHAGRTILLTGDLESPGLERVLSLPARKLDVLMAPHHGSRFPNTPALAGWASPKVVVSSQDKPRFENAEPYSARGAVYLATWPHGAVTIRIAAAGMSVSTFRSRRQWNCE
ncbi:MAG: ComEC/Rec2 family competence protein [Planctomycetes bacterium]|nr:ComEC/Rec2 family competence protein [Planctomycetota bacterium]